MCIGCNGILERCCVDLVGTWFHLLLPGVEECAERHLDCGVERQRTSEGQHLRVSNVYCCVHVHGESFGFHFVICSLAFAVTALAGLASEQ